MKSKLILHCAIGALAVAGVAACGISAADARTARNAGRYGQLEPASAPLLAIVGLAEQRISIYDATGKILEAPVSSGQTGLETPAGVYSIVQKEEEHYSNRYDDASMPFMERITWTGIALHAGVLPGYPASHGCVRMPEDFARKLYRMAQLGMRVIVVREDIAPADIAQPAMFRHSSPDSDPAPMKVAATPEADIRVRLQQAAAAKTLEAEGAARREKEMRQAAAKSAAAASAAARSERAAEANLAKAEADLKALEHAQETASAPAQTADADAAKARALAKVEAAKAELETAKLESKSKTDAAAQAEQEARSAAAAMNVALDAAEEAKQNLSPVSVFISRKTQRLYIRKGNQPVFESPVTIRDPDKPIGAFVYTALNYDGQSGDMRWNVVSMYKDPANIEPPAQVKQGRAKVRQAKPAAAADVAAAQAALDRLVVPQEAASRISEVVLPGSSLIVSDEGASIETGKDTDFVVVMSGEPQGGLKIRQREKREWAGRDGDEDDFGRSSRGVRSRGGGFPFFFSDD